MAIAIVGSPTTYISSADVASGTVAPPSGYQSGDLLVCYADNGFGGTLGLNSTSGVAWTAGPTHTNSGNATHSMWYKISNGTEPASYTISNGTASNLVGACLLYRGVSALKGTPTSSNTASGYVATSTPTPSAPATIIATDLELISYGSGANSAKGSGTTTYTYPTTGWTSRVAIRSTGSGTNGFVASLGVLEAIGGATIATASVAGDTASWVTLAAAFSAAAAANTDKFMPFFV